MIASHDLRGRDAIVIGGASGIGVETVRALASAGGRVVIAARDAAKTGDAVNMLRREAGTDLIEASILDLASLSFRAGVRCPLPRVGSAPAYPHSQHGQHGDAAGLQKHMTREEQTALGWFDAAGTPRSRFKSPAQGRGDIDLGCRRSRAGW